MRKQFIARCYLHLWWYFSHNHPPSVLRHRCCQGIPLPSANLERLRPICGYVRWEENEPTDEKYTHKKYFANSSRQKRQVWKSERTQLGWKLHSHSTSGAEGSCPRHFSNLRIRAYLISTFKKLLDGHGHNYFYNSEGFMPLHLQESPIEGLVTRIVSWVHARDVCAPKDSTCFDWRPIGVIIAKVVKSSPAMMSSHVSNCSFSKLVMLLVTFFTCCSVQYTPSSWYTYEKRRGLGVGGCGGL